MSNPRAEDLSLDPARSHNHFVPSTLFAERAETRFVAGQHREEIEGESKTD